MPAASIEQLGQLALSMWATQAMAAFDLLLKTERRVLEEGIPAVLRPAEAPEARRSFLEAVRMAATPQDLEAVLGQRASEVGWSEMVRQLSVLSRPPRG